MNKEKIKALALFVCIISVIAVFPACKGKNKAVSYEFTNVRRGTVERTVSTSGTINPVSTVKVLPQMSGKVEKIYVDYNDLVRKGDILAELNTDMLKLRREQQNASVIKAKANYELQQINYSNQAALAEKKLISEYELKTSKTTMENSAADLAVAESNLRVIDTEINQYAYIISPIDGIVLDRKINVGDTVVDSSSSNSSAIFTLAENLSEMQIEAGVGELDVVSIYGGQEVRFTLESLPGRKFSGVVETLRMVPAVSNNVVSYTVIIKVENQEGSLFPGMTCAVDFIVERSVNALLVPNAALRYQPTNLDAEKIADMIFNAGLENMSDEQRNAAIEARSQARAQNAGTGGNQNQGTGITGLVMGGGGRMMGGPPPGGGPGGGRQGANSGANSGVNSGANGGQGARRGGSNIVIRNLWFVSEEGKPEVMRVEAGISDGSFTEIRSRDSNFEGRQFILREKI